MSSCFTLFGVQFFSLSKDAVFFVCVLLDRHYTVDFVITKATKMTKVTANRLNKKRNKLHECQVTIGASNAFHLLVFTGSISF